MKITFLVLVTLFGVQGMAASKVTYHTLLTCQQDDGDDWVEAGLRRNEQGRQELIVVAHSTDNGTATLVARRLVNAEIYRNRTVYADSNSTVGLTVTSGGFRRRLRLYGDLTVLKDGPGSIDQMGLSCIRNSSISFDSNR